MADVRSVAWALLHRSHHEVTVVAVADDILLTHRGGEWHGDVYGIRGAADKVALSWTEEAELKGMELVAGPVEFEADSETYAWDYQALADKVMTTLWKARLPHPRAIEAEVGLAIAARRATEPECWTSASGVGVR